MYCVLRPGYEPSDELRAEVRTQVAQVLGKAFAPADVRFVAALPRTRTAKIVRRAVRAAALGEEQGDLSSLENPAALDEVASAR